MDRRGCNWPARLALCLMALTLAACGSTERRPHDGPDRGPVVLAAISMQDALEDVGDAWAAHGHPRPVLSFAGTSALARQLQHGATADIFLSADEEWMDVLARDGLVDRASRLVVAGNSILLVSPKQGGPPRFAVDNRAAFKRALGRGRLAMAEPDAVPAGRYGKAALQATGLWPVAAPHIVRTDNVRGALALAERQEVPLALVYATDASASDQVVAVAEFPADSHPPIHYPAARLIRSRHPDAAAFLEFLGSGEAIAIFRRYGFFAVKEDA